MSGLPIKFPTKSFENTNDFPKLTFGFNLTHFQSAANQDEVLPAQTHCDDEKIMLESLLAAAHLR